MVITMLSVRNYFEFFPDPAGTELEEMRDDEMEIVRMKTRQMRREELNKSLVAEQQGSWQLSRG